MKKSAWELIWTEFLERYFLLGKRWILLLPFILVPANFWLANEILSLPDSETALTNPYFLIPSLLVVLACAVVFWIVTSRPPPEDQIVIAVTRFSPVSPDAKDKAENARDRLVEALRDRLRDDQIKGEVKKLRETVDPRGEGGKKRARILGKHNRTHIVISGTVRVEEDNEFYFYPYITRLVVHPYRYSPEGDEAAQGPLSVPDRDGFEFEKKKRNQIAELAVFVCGMARLNSFQYEEAAKILSTISEPSPEVWFYRGFALLHLGQKERAMGCFAKAALEDPGFAYAWTYSGIALRELGRADEARDAYDQARRLVERSSRGTDQDLYLVLDQLRRTVELLQETQAVIEAFHEPIEDAGNELLDVYDQMLADLELEPSKELFAEGHYEEAIAVCDDVLKKYPGFGPALAEKGFALRKLGKTDETQELLQEAVTVVTDDAVTDDARLARAYAVLGDRERTLEHVSRELEKHPRHVVRALFSVYDEFDPYRHDEAFTGLLGRGPTASS